MQRRQLMVFKDCVRVIPFDYECLCRCHSTGAKHIIACCAICQNCKKNVRNSKIKEHTKACGEASRVNGMIKPSIEIKPIKLNFPVIGKLLKCRLCHRLILVEDAINGVSHTIATVVVCWECLSKKTQKEAIKRYNIKF